MNRIGTSIRQARVEDITAISSLLQQLGHLQAQPLLAARLAEALVFPDQEMLVYTMGTHIIGLAALHFVAQLPLNARIAIVTYLAVHPLFRNKGIGAELAAQCGTLALQQDCVRLQLLCGELPQDVRRFYERQGYGAAWTCLTKELKP